MFPLNFYFYFQFLIIFFESTSGLEFQDHSKVGVVGGEPISISQVPFMVSVRLNDTYHWCGGSIIHEQFILTAAHCIMEDEKYKVLVGTDLLNQGGQLYDVEKMIIHKYYSDETNDYDIGIIKLTQPLVFGAKVRKVKLPKKGTKIRKKYMVTVIGWGDTSENGKFSNDLLQVTIPVKSSKSCQRALGAEYTITPRMFCAGDMGKDTCQGDSGGPLFYANKQLGITSFGLGCGSTPGVYTKVPPLIPWIKKTMEENL